jgi:hypothetical protein
MALEEGGVPTVALHTDTFARLARSVARVNGMPTTRQAFVPQPLVGRTATELRGYIEGADPINNRPFAREMLEALTRPLDAADAAGASFDRSTPRLLEPDTEEGLRRRFEDERWTDFLPIVLPTEQRVDEMLTGTGRGRDEVVGQLRPTQYREAWEFTVEKVAVNAVMAGARPSYLPVILAMAASGVTARHSSTTSYATMAVVNGPVRDELGMNAGIGAMGPYDHASATIGRAHGLLSQNLQGGSVPGETYMGSQGNGLAYSFAFAENEERSPWQPFHVQHGFEAAASTVSLFLGGWYTIFGTGLRDETWEETLRRSLRACDASLGPALILDPLVADSLVRRGFDTKDKLIAWLAEASRVPAREYWDNQWNQTIARPHAVAGVEPFATRLRARPDELVQMYRPEDLNVLVVGGETTPTWRLMAAHFGGDIVSIDDWR